MDRVHRVHGSFTLGYVASPRRNGLGEPPDKWPWTASTSALRDCGTLQMTHQVCKNKTGFEHCHFKLSSQESERRLCGLTSSLTSTEGSSWVAGTWMSFSQATPSVGHSRQVITPSTECLQGSILSPQPSRPVLPDLITLPGRWSRPSNERLCGAKAKDRLWSHIAGVQILALPPA